MKRPNIIVVLLDDVGFSDIGCYGAEIATPAMDKLAAGGVRYNNFHVTPMCSPTRASLLSGRNPHAVGVGIVAEWANGMPGYDGRVHPTAGMLPQVLRENGYNTLAVGKWHLTATEEYGAAGPFSNWPLAKGFNRWYGFHGALTDQFHPELCVDNHLIHVEPEPGYHLTEDLVDNAIGMVRDHLSTSAGRPFFMYLALGACHWPHQAPKEFIDRQRGRYDQGWDEVRAQRLKKQLELGIVPPGTELSPRDAVVRAWPDLRQDDDAVTLSTRLQEAYAGFMEHTDLHLGRLFDALEALAIDDNTAVLVLSDNGASAEGGATGAINLRKHMVYEKDDRHRARVQPLLDGLGPGQQHPAEVVQEEHARRGHPRAPHLPLARRDCRQGRGAHAVLQRDRHHADAARAAGDRAARHARRRAPATAARHGHEWQLRECVARVPSATAVFRTAR